MEVKGVKNKYTKKIKGLKAPLYYFFLAARFLRRFLAAGFFAAGFFGNNITAGLIGFRIFTIAAVLRNAAHRAHAIWVELASREQTS